MSRRTGLFQSDRKDKNKSPKIIKLIFMVLWIMGNHKVHLYFARKSIQINKTVKEYLLIITA